jgi:hypothetical protein
VAIRAGDRRQRRARLAQRHPFDRANQVGVSAPLTRAAAVQPSLGGAQRHAGVGSGAGEGHVVLEMGAQHPPAVHRVRAARVGQSGRGDRAHASIFPVAAERWR